MSMPMDISSKCCVCGNVSEQTVLASTNTFGSPDLDLRPPEMKRSTMHWWIMECPSCGYVAGDLEQATCVDEQWLKGEEYTTCSGIRFVSYLAARFYRQYLIQLQEGNTERAFHAVLHAAWDCDDCNDRENAARCRVLALEQIGKMIEESPENDNLWVLKADLLRRTGMFEELKLEYEGRQFSEDLLNQIVRFQLDKAAQGDTRCYRVEDVMHERK